MKNQFTFLVSGLLAVTPLCVGAHEHEDHASEAAAQPAVESDPTVIKKNSSYAFGFNNGKQFINNMGRFGVSNDDIDQDQFIKGFLDAMAAKEPEGGEEQLQAAMLGLQNMIKEREDKLAADNLAAAEAFLADNKKREGVVTTESGLQYEILTAGEGETYDGTAGTNFKVNYKGTLADGTEFDASPEGSPVTMSLNVVPGFKEALSAMPVGSKWKVYLKPDLAYGPRRRSELIGPNQLLIFELGLEEIIKPAPKPKAVSPPIQIPPRPEKTEGE